MPVDAIRVPIKAVRVPIVIEGEPKEAARVHNTLTASTTLLQTWESTCDSLLQANWVLVDCRGLENALEAVRVSVEAVRVSLEAVRVSVEAVRVSIEALRCFRGRFKKFWNKSKRFGFVPKFFRLNGKVLLLF
jgi:hypothetical protein